MWSFFQRAVGQAAFIVVSLEASAARAEVAASATVSPPMPAPLGLQAQTSALPSLRGAKLHENS